MTLRIFKIGSLAPMKPSCRALSWLTLVIYFTIVEAGIADIPLSCVQIPEYQYGYCCICCGETDAECLQNEIIFLIGNDCTNCFNTNPTCTGADTQPWVAYSYCYPLFCSEILQIEFSSAIDGRILRGIPFTTDPNGKSPLELLVNFSRVPCTFESSKLIVRYLGNDLYEQSIEETGQADHVIRFDPFNEEATILPFSPPLLNWEFVFISNNPKVENEETSLSIPTLYVHWLRLMFEHPFSSSSSFKTKSEGSNTYVEMKGQLGLDTMFTALQGLQSTKDKSSFGTEAKYLPLPKKWKFGMEGNFIWGYYTKNANLAAGIALKVSSGDTAAITIEGTATLDPDYNINSMILSGQSELDLKYTQKIFVPVFGVPIPVGYVFVKLNTAFFFEGTFSATKPSILGENVQFIGSPMLSAFKGDITLEIGPAVGIENLAAFEVSGTQT